MLNVTHSNLNVKIFEKNSVSFKNPLFREAKIYILREGFNPNGSYITREAINKAIPTLYNTAIVGSFNEDTNNYTDHNVTLRSDNRLKLGGVPIGLIPETAEVYWEKVKENNGDVVEYLVIDGVILWYARYPDEVSVLLQEKMFGQSAEIAVVEDEVKKINGVETEVIHEFVFLSLCILGVSKSDDVLGHVAPAYEQAKILTYSANPAFKKEYEEMLTLFYSKGESNMTEEEVKKINKLSDKSLSDTTEDAAIEEEEVKVPEKEKEELPTQEEEAELSKAETETVEEAKEQAEKATKEEEEALTALPQEEADKADSKVEPEQTEDETDDEAEALEDVETFSLADFEALKKDNAELLQRNEMLQTAVTELQSTVRMFEEKEVKAKFFSILEEEVIDKTLSENKKSDLKEVETLLFAQVGIKSFSANPVEKSTKIQVAASESELTNPYAGLLD